MQLDPLLRATISPEGDVNDDTGYSPFPGKHSASRRHTGTAQHSISKRVHLKTCPPDAPGNINQLVLRLAPYVEELRRHHGVIAEFVNPKYADASRSIFKSSTRLECMMQVREGGRGQGAQGLHCA